ncbi:MAG: hypothetical protein Tsb0032_14240 [Kiloniellaceae bacterium]
MKLSTRLMLGMVTLVLGASLAIGLLAYHTLTQSIYPNQLTRMEADAQLMADRLGDTVREAMGDVAVNAAAPVIDELMLARQSQDSAAEAEWKRRLTELFTATLNAKPEYLQIRLIGVEDSGREVVRVERPAAGGVVRVVAEEELQVKGERPYYAETLFLLPGEIYVSPPDLNREFGQIETPTEPVVRVATPVFGRREQTLGIVVINIDLRPAFGRLRQSVDAGIEAYVVNGSGDYLVHPDRSREFAFEFGAPQRLQDEFPELAEMLQPLDHAMRSSRSIEDKEQVEYAAAAARQRLGVGFDIAVLLMAPRSVVLAPADAILQSALKAALVAIVVALLLAIVIARTVARPLARVTKSIEALDKGQTVSLPRNAPQEVDILVSAFRYHVERERLFNAAIQSSADAVVTISLEGRITAWNRAAEDLFGYSAEEAVGQSIDMLIPEGRTKEHWAFRERFLQGLATGPVETTRLTRDGRCVDVSLTVSPVRSMTDEVTGASAIYRDVTAERHANAMFRLAVDASPAAMLMTDREGRIHLANSEAESLFGYSGVDLLGMRIEDLMPAQSRDGHRKLREDFFAHSSKRMMGEGRDLHGLRRDGSEFPLEIALNPIESPQGPMVLSVVVDVTKRKADERALRIATQTAERANDMKSQFLANMSHELRTPLNAIIGYSELMMMGIAGPVEPPQYNTYVKDIHAGGKHLLALINDLLDISKAESGKLELEEEPFQLIALLEEAMSLLRGQAVQKGVELTMAAEKDSPWIFADRRLIKQVIVNLVGNAVKFTPSGGGVRLFLEKGKKGSLRILVEDDGVGIPEEQIPNAFGVFTQVRNAYRRQENTGTGLGLALCKRFVEMHEGRIDLRSQVDVGTTVTITLPPQRCIDRSLPGAEAVAAATLDPGGRRAQDGG